MTQLEDDLRGARALTAVSEPSELCQCPICGRVHRHLADDPPTTASEAFSYILKTTDDHGVCIGGRFNGWLMWLHPDGQWVSIKKLERALAAATEAPNGR